MADRQMVSAAVDSQRDAYIRVLQDLVRASEGGLDATQACVAEQLEAMGCAVQTIKCDPRTLSTPHEFTAASELEPGEKTSVAGRYQGAGGGRSILLWAHPDAAPVTGIEHWRHAPFAGEVEGGRLFGWGAADDLSGVGIMTCALAAVLAAGYQPKGDVILASTASKKHAQGIIAVMDEGYEADASIYLHPAETGNGLRDIKAITSGGLSFRITVPGQPPDTTEPGHTSLYHLAVDPIKKAWLVYQALDALAERRAKEVHHPVISRWMGGRSTSMHISYIHSGDAAVLGRVATECVLAGRMIFPPPEELSDVQAQIEGAIQAVVDQDEFLRNHPPVIEWLYGINRGAEVAETSEFYQAVRGAIHDITGIEPHNYPLHALSDIRNTSLYRGIPTVGFGPQAGDSTQIGGHDEWIDVEDYLESIKVVASILVDWCGV